MVSSQEFAYHVMSCDNLDDLKHEIMPYLISMRKQWAVKINDLISESGLTKTEFAELCEVSRQSVSKWCSGTLPKAREDYIKIGFASGMNMDELDEFLKKYGRFSGLYPKSLEDSIYIFVSNSNSIKHTYKNCKSIINYIKKEIESLNWGYDEDTMGTATVKFKLLGLKDQKELLNFILRNSNSFNRRYYKLFDYIEKFIAYNSVDVVTNQPLSLSFLAEEQQWPSSLRHAVYQIRKRSWFPMRSKLITLGLYLNMNLVQLNEMLELACMEHLNAANPVECVVIFAVNDAELNNAICLDGGTELIDYVREVLSGLEIEESKDLLADFNA